MENKARKMFAAVVVIMLCAVAIVGVGYAYTATTSNQNNTVTSEYITLSQDGTGAYRFLADNEKVYYNTENTGVGTYTYTLTNEVVTNTSYNAVKIGNTFSVVASQSTGAAHDLTCALSILAGTITLTDGWKLLINYTNNNSMNVWKVLDAGTYSTSSDLSSASFVIEKNESSFRATNVDFYIGYLIGSAPETAPNATPFSGVKFGFTVTEIGENVGIQLSRNTASIVGTGTATVTAMVVGGYTFSGNVTWESSDNGIATVTSDGTNKAVCTITGVSAGTVTITATENGHQAICIVTVSAAS